MLDEHATEKRAASPVGTGKITVGRNGVAIESRTNITGDFRTYEVYQRKRVAESTEKISASQLISPAYMANPFPFLEILRENYPCYKDWVSNAVWISRYDDVTSVFVDDGNFESRSKLWDYGLVGYGRDLRHLLPVQRCFEKRVDASAKLIAEDIIAASRDHGTIDLARDFAAVFALKLMAAVLDIPPQDFGLFARLYWEAQQGATWEPMMAERGHAAMRELTAYLQPLLRARRAVPGEDLISVMAGLELESVPVSAEDIVVTMLEGDYDTLHGSLANLCFLLVTHPDQLDLVRGNRRFLKLAYLETLRHSPPVLSAKRYATHEVERFGQLIPEGHPVICSAAAANRDPRVFNNPNSFLVDRNDLCAREPRGQYRSDGLATGIAFGLGKPSRQPGVPEDRPRSLYAITRDAVMAAASVLLDTLPGLRLQAGQETPALKMQRPDSLYTCWHLPVAFEVSKTAAG